MSKLRALMRWFFGAAFVGGVGVAIFLALRPKPISVDLATATRGHMMVTIQEDGKTRIRERYVVSAPLSGRLLRIEMDPGDAVVQGESLLAAITPRAPELLDARELTRAEMRVKAREAALAQAEPAVERARVALEYAESNYGRTSKARKTGAVTEDSLHRAETEFRMSQEDYRSAVFSERIAKYELALAKSALVRTRDSRENDETDLEILSPINGTVLRVPQESTTIVSPGTPLLELGDPTDLEVQVDVLSTDAVRVMPGATVFLERWGGDSSLNGNVRLVEPSAFTKISALGVEEQRVNVIIDLVDPPEVRRTLGDGFRVEARIVVWQSDSILKVPSGALFRDGDQWAVFAVEGNVAHIRQVDLGQQNDVEAEVLSGLSADDQVILHPSDKIQDQTEIVAR